MTKQRDQITNERRRLQREYGSFFETVAELLFRYDPIEINFESNTDEYEPEAGSIIPKLRECHSADDVRQMVHKVFITWFDPDIAGPDDRYAQLAVERWDLWQKTSFSKKI